VGNADHPEPHVEAWRELIDELRDRVRSLEDANRENRCIIGAVQGGAPPGCWRRPGAPRSGVLVEEGVRRVSAPDELELLAWAILETVNEAQAKGSTVRLVVPRDPEVAEQLSTEPDDVRLLSAVGCLEEWGYLARRHPTHGGAYTITPAGFEWLEEGPPTLSEQPETATDKPERGEPRPGGEGPQEGAERRWWRRVFEPHQLGGLQPEDRVRVPGGGPDLTLHQQVLVH
jgi:hypothetical protein